MAQFNYEAYEANRQKNSNANGNGERAEVHFMGEYLGNDGDSVIVRFPYHSMNDIVFETVHKVMGVFPNNKYGKFVSCTGEADCPLCSHKDEATRKQVTRFYCKAIAYVADATGKVTLTNVVWDRPAAFADIDLKNLMTEYGDLTELLFKIKRSGKGTDTKYTIMPVMNKTVYPDSVYVADFTELNTIDATRILCKTMDQYKTALTGEEPAKKEPAAAPVEKEEVVETKATVEVKDDPLPESFTAPKKEEVVETPSAQPTATTERKRYVF